MSSSVETDPPRLEARRDLAGRPADRVDRLLESAVEVLREGGYEGLTVRNVARRAGVAPATAYNYFGSKDHLVAEVFWRRLQALPATVDASEPVRERAERAIREVAMIVADEPELSAACTTAMLAHDPDVRRLRDRIGASIHHRLATALGDDADESVLRTLDLLYSGAMLQAGMGHLSYDDLGDRLSEVATLLLGSRR
jgi:AcrR family transcriptional regulator